MFVTQISTLSCSPYMYRQTVNSIGSM
jgi:hypothetical protein